MSSLDRPLRLLRAAARRASRRWRRSLQFRVVASTIVLGVLVVALIGAYLYQEIAQGLQRDRIESAQVESRARAQTIQKDLDVSTATQTPGQLSLTAADAVKIRGSDTSGGLQYIVLTRSLNNTNSLVVETAESGGEVGLAEIPADLRTAVAADPEHQQTALAPVPGTAEDGTAVTVPAVIVGEQVTVPRAGPYDVYFVYPMDREQRTLDVISRSIGLGGVFLVVLVSGVAWLVTRQVVAPVRRVAHVARRLSSGELGERANVSGEDDLALLAQSFNDMADNLQAQIRQLEGLSRVQQRFTSDVSHELRTPLTTIRMASELIYDGRESMHPVVQRSAELLHGEVERFEALLTDLLEISRFDAGAAGLECTTVDLGDLTRRVIEAAAPIAAARSTVVRLHPGPAPVLAEVDSRRIERILRNLVVNAIEHGEGRPVDVYVARNEDTAAVLVRDRGVGLRPGEASLVFNRFWRADPARNRTTGGTGLGLAIALEDARLHGGWLQAWGEPDAGSRFRLTVPCSQGDSVRVSPLPLAPGPDAVEDSPGVVVVDGAAVEAGTAGEEL